RGPDAHRHPARAHRHGGGCGGDLAAACVAPPCRRHYSAQGIARRAVGAPRPAGNALGPGRVLTSLVLYLLFVPLVRQFTVLNVFNYITFRAAGAAVTALLLSFIIGPPILRQLRRKAYHQVVREGTPDSHQAKSA